MLDLIGTTVITAAIVVNLNAVITMMPLSSAQRLTAVAIAGLWIGLAIALAGTGAYADVATPVPAIGVIAGLPLVAAAIAALSSAKVREALLALPVPLLVGLNIMRVFGAFCLVSCSSARTGRWRSLSWLDSARSTPAKFLQRIFIVCARTRIAEFLLARTNFGRLRAATRAWRRTR